MPAAFARTRLTRIVQSRQNARVKQLRAAFAGSSPAAGDNIAIEGVHLLAEAVASGLRFSIVFIEEGNEAVLDRIGVPAEVEVLVLPREIFISAVATESPQGVAALVEPSRFLLEEIFPPSRPALIVIAAGLQDPGNLGTLARTAEAFGATGMVLLPGTVSLFNQKTLRASAGSAFRLPAVVAEANEVFGALAEHGVLSLAAVATGAPALTLCDLTQPVAIILGNEGGGIPPEILARAGAQVSIPMPGPVESLNAAVAGSILLYEAARQRAYRPSSAPAGSPSPAPSGSSVVK
jgi:TrmH family RNA methyltransferase